ncbi:serine O-acetyltransferase EpsC [Treponema brennaborense]|uniref:Serine O-acetyltransferase n=1 Tax=Treponema brennaborense (strain DSM 12168 / CIP 105900 / DD5/3) TaxID=906968 RepID=F4LLS4_TREBD|nr:serine O-acetyltransferase EpsC [Treponema brennaborense]AEE17718.1 Serine O-acetyltransferase [Treponema brennaborense DSM 12168]
MTPDVLIDNIIASYAQYGGINSGESQTFPNRQNVVTALQDLQSLIFPGFRTAEQVEQENLHYIIGEKINRIIAVLTREIQKALLYLCKNCGYEKTACFGLAEKTTLALIEAIPEIRRKINLDTKAALAGDPAAKSSEEIILSYPGLEAVVVYRIAHFLHENGVPVIPRIMSEHVHGKTGIDIHPGALIGESFFIDHGTGVVIGETCVIGKNVKIYQGVTLGALSVHKKLQDKKRHPTIEDNVTIYAGATILGGNTVIGKNSVIGGNTWVTESVPPDSTITIN